MSCRQSEIRQIPGEFTLVELKDPNVDADWRTSASRTAHCFTRLRASGGALRDLHTTPDSLLAQDSSRRTREFHPPTVRVAIHFLSHQQEELRSEEISSRA